MHAIKRLSVVVILVFLLLPLFAEPIALRFASAQEASPASDSIVDLDSDGIADENDNCFDIGNIDQTDTDADGAGDACDSTPLGDPDTDGDGISDSQDECPGDATNSCNLPSDTDGDGIADDQDECPDDATNACNLPSDKDGDGIADDQDACPNDPIDSCILPTETPELPTATETPVAETETPTMSPTTEPTVAPASVLVSVGDFVWYDTNANGLQDVGESGAAGVTITLHESDGTTAGTTTTDANGYYAFTDLNPSTFYRLKFDNPEGYVWTLQNQAGGNGSDSAVQANGWRGFTSPATGANSGEPGQADNPRLDAGLTAPTLISVGDRVWYDSNGNGLQDLSEPGAAGVTVTLYDSSNAAIDTTSTDSNGYYWFTDLEPNTQYHLKFDAPAGYVWTVAHAAGGNGTDSQVGPLGQVFFTYTGLGSNQGGPGQVDNPRLDAGLTPSGPVSVGDFVWYDTNANGLQDVGEPGAAGVTVALFTNLGQDLVDTTTTDANGYYAFADLEPNAQYQLRFDNPAGYVWTRPRQAGGNGTDSTVQANGWWGFFSPVNGSNLSGPGQADNPRLDGGLVEAGFFSAGDFVWYDTNANGLQDSGEPGASGVAVSLYDSQTSALLGTTTTDANGYYAFTDLEPNAPNTYYRLEFSRPAGYVWTLQGQAGGNGTDSMVDSEGNAYFHYAGVGSNLGGPGQADDPKLDAGLIEAGPVSVGDFVWYDINKNGLQDSGEPGASGIAVHLFDENDNQVGTTTTGATGYYAFTDLEPSAYYRLQFDKPDGYVWTLSFEAGGDGTDSVVETDGSTGFDSPLAGSNLSDPGQADDPTLDAGLIEAAPVSVGDFVWYDTNKNGLQDSGEPGASGVTVTVSNENGDPVGTTSTDSNGYYAFTDLEPNTPYLLQFDKPTGYAWTFSYRSDGDGTDSVVDSDGYVWFNSPVTGSNLSGPDDADNPTLDAGLVEIGPVSVGDFVWYDTNKNGLQDAGEPGASGINVSLLQGTGEGAELVSTTTTDSNGNYSFVGLTPGTRYRLEFDKPTGYTWTLQDVPANDEFGIQSVVDSQGVVEFDTPLIGFNLNDPGQADDPMLDAGLVEFQPVSVGDFVWNDTNENGLQDVGEPGTPGITVILYDEENTSISTTTDANGYYSFTGLQPDTQYQLEFSQPNDSYWTLPYQSDGDGTDSVVNGDGLVRFTSPSTGSNLAGPGQADNPKLDAGLVEIASTPTESPTAIPTTTAYATYLPSASPTSTASNTPTQTDTPTRTSTPSNTPASSATPTGTRSPSSTPTKTITPTWTVTRTNTPANTPTRAPTLIAGGFAPGSAVKPSTWLNLRKGPGTSNAIVTVLPPGTICQVTGYAVMVGSQPWYPIACGEFGAGYVSGKYLVMTSPPPTAMPSRTPTAASPATVTRTATATFTAGPATTTPVRTATSAPTIIPGGFAPGDWARTRTRLNLRSGPGTNHSVVKVLSSGAICQVTGAPTIDSRWTWYPVSCAGFGSGYVAGAYLAAVTPPAPTVTPTITRTPGPATNTPVATSTPTRIPGGFAPGDWVRTTTRLNLRGGPGTNHAVLAVLPTGAACKVTGNPTVAGGYTWYPVNCGGYGSGHVAGEYLKP